MPNSQQLLLIVWDLIFVVGGMHTNTLCSFYGQKDKLIPGSNPGKRYLDLA